MKKIWFVLIILMLTCGCESNKNEAKTYTITNETGIKKIVSYGTVVCDEIICAEIPKNSQISSRCSIGERVEQGQILAEYLQYGAIKTINANSNGIVCQPKEKSNGIYYYNLDNVSVITQISESDIGYISVGDKVKIIGEGLSKKEYSGKITQLSPTAKKEQNGTFVECTIKLTDPDKSITPGFSVRIEKETELLNSVKIPINAVCYDENGCYVIKLEQEQQIKKYISNIVFNDGDYVICTELKADEILKIYE